MSSEPSVLSRSILGSSTATDVLDKYELGRVLGRGAFATTRVAVEKATGRQFACKSMLKRSLEHGGEGEDVRRELDIMLHLSGAWGGGAVGRGRGGCGARAASGSVNGSDRPANQPSNQTKLVADQAKRTWSSWLTGTRTTATST
jgi:hypothetical protein